MSNSRFFVEMVEKTCKRPAVAHLACAILRQVHQGHHQQQATITIHKNGETDGRV
jgi:hypothetical protein